MDPILTSSDWTALLLSFRVALLGVAIMSPPALAVAWLLARIRFPGRILLEALVSAPLVMPPVVTGFLMLQSLGANGFLGRHLYNWFGLRLPFSWLGAAVAAAVMGFPLMVRSSRLAFEAVDSDLERVAYTMGRGPLDTFLRVTLPLAWPGILSGLLLGFVRSLGEFGATITFAGNIDGVTRTLPLAIYTALQTPGDEHRVTALVALSFLLSLTALVASPLLRNRQLAPHTQPK